MVVHPTGVGTCVSSASAFPSSRAARSSGMRDDLERRAEHELARVQHERLVAVGLDQRGQVVLLQRRVDVGVPGVVEDPEEPVEPDVDARGLHQPRVVGLQAEAPLGDRGLDVAVGQQHGAESRESLRSLLRANLLNPRRRRAVHHRRRRTSAAGHPARTAPDGPEGTRRGGRRMKSKRVQALILAAAVAAGYAGAAAYSAWALPSVPVVSDFGPGDGLTRYVLTASTGDAAGLLPALESTAGSSTRSGSATAAPSWPPRGWPRRTSRRSRASPTPSSRRPCRCSARSPTRTSRSTATTWTTPGPTPTTSPRWPTPTSTPPRAGTAGPATAAIVAVVDTGYDSDHPELAGALWTNPAESCGSADTDGNGKAGDCHGWNFTTNSADVDNGSYGIARHQRLRRDRRPGGQRARHRRRRPRRHDHAAGHRQRVLGRRRPWAPRRSATPSTTAPTSSTPPGAAPPAAGPWTTCGRPSPTPPPTT